MCCERTGTELVTQPDTYVLLLYTVNDVSYANEFQASFQDCYFSISLITLFLCVINTVHDFASLLILTLVCTVNKKKYPNTKRHTI